MIPGWSGRFTPHSQAYRAGWPTAILSLDPDRRLSISWQEVDRLPAEAEYAAALLVAAVIVEFVP
jgi:hypothetical protein